MAMILKRQDLKLPRHVLFLLKNKAKGSFSEISLYQAVADLIAAKDISTVL